MKKDDLLKMLDDTKRQIEYNELSYSRIRRLWIQINCLKQTVEDIVTPKKVKENEIDDGF